MGASQGIITGSFLLFTVLFFSSLILGRGFCGWLCPAAGLQEGCFAVVDRRTRGGEAQLDKILHLGSLGYRYCGHVRRSRGN